MSLRVFLKILNPALLPVAALATTAQYNKHGSFWYSSISTFVSPIKKQVLVNKGANKNSIEVPLLELNIKLSIFDTCHAWGNYSKTKQNFFSAFKQQKMVLTVNHREEWGKDVKLVYENVWQNYGRMAKFLGLRNNYLDF